MKQNRFLMIFLCALFFAGISFAQDDEEYSEEYEAVEAIESDNSVKEAPDSQFVTQVEEENMRDPLTDVRQDSATEAAKVIVEEDDSSKDKQKEIHWAPIGICAGVVVAGGILAYVFDKQAKDATSIPPSTATEYRKGYDDSGKYQNLRNISLGVAALGLVGIGLTFLF